MRKRIVKFEVFTTLVSLAVGIVLHLTTHDWQLAVAIALATEVLLHLFAFALRYGPVLERIEEACPEDDIHPLAAVKQMREHAIPLELLANAPGEWCLQERLDQVIEQFKRDLKDLASRQYTVPMDDILDPSLKVCERVMHSAFCTALDKHVPIFATSLGQKLKQANYEAAARIGKGGAFTRLFILEDKSSVDKFTYELMQENASYGIEVLAIELGRLVEVFRANHLKTDGLDDLLDFGLWDDRYLMRITGDDTARYLHVTADKRDLEEARKVIGVLRNAAYTWGAFRAELRKPINGPGGGWSTYPEKILHLPPPNGPHAEDVTKIFAVVKQVLPANGRLGILGLTHRLIEEAKTLPSIEHFKSIEIDVIDCREYHPPGFDSVVRFQNANWLEWRPKRRYDVILGDDVLCNLGVWQIPMFFESLAAMMEIGAVFIVRTTAIFSPHLMHPSKREVAVRLKRIKDQIENDPGLSFDLINQSSVYELAWPMLHADDYYDKSRCMFDFGRWDDFVKDEFGSDAAFANRLLLPYDVGVTSVDYGELKTMALPWFEVVQEEIEVHSVWQSDDILKTLTGADDIASTFRQYYRILIFRRRV